MKINNNLDEMNLKSLPEPGVSQFEILSAREETDGALVRIKLQLKLFLKDKIGFMNDEIAANDIYKIKSFCQSIGIMDMLNRGVIVVDELIGKTGKIRHLILKDKCAINSIGSNGLEGCFPRGYGYLIGGNGYGAGSNGYLAGGNGYCVGSNGYCVGTNGYLMGANVYGVGANGYSSGCNGYL